MNGRIQKERYLKAFLIGFFMMAICYIPFLIVDGGLFIYYGDYNAQQIPFYKMIHDAVKSGNIFWNWHTDLGTNTIASYSFYLFGSPFFWMTIPFPSSWIPYMMPFIMCLKYGFATLTSYAYIRRFVKSTDVALIGAITYAFSGFSAYNIFFNHFHDVICFFPLILIGLEEAVVNNRKGCFALSVALLATINYYFFVGQVVFLVIYFVLRLIYSKEFKLTFSKFLSLAFESVVGVGIAAVILMPSVMMVLQNPRVGAVKVLLGWKMVYYPNSYNYLSIIQSMFFVPDIPAMPNFFPDTAEKWSSVAGYLPLFSMAGVIAFFSKFKKHWIKAVLLICALCSFIPTLNSMFQLFNSAYYARWFYMPILIMSLATAVYIDRYGLDLRFGIASTTLVTVLFASIGILPVYNMIKDDAGNKIGSYLTIGTLPDSRIKFWITVSFSFTALLILALLYRMRKSKKIIKYTTVLTCISAIGVTIMMMTFGRLSGPSTHAIKDNALNQKFELADQNEQFYRIDPYNSLSNSNMYWGYPSMQSFHSIIPGSAFNYYKSIGFERSVKTELGSKRYGIRGLESVKYCIVDKNSKIKYQEMPGFEYIGDQGDFSIYENKYFVPMGYMYGCYFDTEQLNTIKPDNVDKLYMQGLYLTDEQIEKYSQYYEKLPELSDYQLTKSLYLEACENLADRACTYFKYDNYGFTAKATASDTGLMVFSVPYEAGWSATVNGKSVDIETVQNGFMAVLVPKGNVEIRFTYQTPGLKLGLLITVISIILFILYMILWKILKNTKKDRFETKKYEHLNLFETVSEVALKDEYALKLASEEIFEDETEEIVQSADFLKKKPKAVNAFVFKEKKVERNDETKPETEEVELLSEETRQALQNMSDNISEEDDNNAS